MTEPRPLAAEVASGDRRRALTALRDRLAAEIDGGQMFARELAMLAQRLQSVMAELEALPTPREGTPSDELEKRRAARRTNPDVSVVVAAGDKPRRRR